MTPVSAAIDSRFLKPLDIMCGADAVVGYLIDNEMAAMLATPWRSLTRRSSNVMSSTRGSKMVPESYTYKP